MIKKMLLELDVSKGSGEDGITNKMLKMVASSISIPLTTLFQKLLNKKSFPDCWKLGTI
jgi:hypothetical protein